MNTPIPRILRQFPFREYSFVAVLVLACGFAPGYAESAELPRDGDEIVARVGQLQITAVELEEELARRSGGKPGAFAQPAERRSVLDEMVERLVLVTAADQAGYAEDPGVRRAFEDLMVQRYRQDHLDQALAEIEISEKEVEAFYQENLELYRLPARRRTALLKLPAGNEEAGKAAAETHERALELGDEVTDFGALAAEVSHDRATRYRGGDMGYLSPEVSYRWPKEVVAAAFALEKVGQVTEPIEAGGFFWLVRLVEDEKVVHRSLPEVAATIRHELNRQKRRELRDAMLTDLQSTVDVAISEEALAAIEAPPEQKPPSLPSDR
jgi:parvulin-like peptidyl-prolyl isomerase